MDTLFNLACSTCQLLNFITRYMLKKIFAHQYKIILTVVAIAMVAAVAYTWFKAPEYLSVTTALPSSVYSNDKSRLFNENIQLLYSDLGSADELDVIAGSGQLDTVYLAVTDQFNLFDHYRLKSPKARALSAEILKGKTSVIKSGNGELKISVWDTDPDLAPQLANAIMDQLQLIHTEARNAGNQHMIRHLKQKLDSSSIVTEPGKNQEEKITQLKKLLAEYETIAEVKAPALVVIEKARPAIRPDRPRVIPILIAVFILSLLLSVLLAVYRERTSIS